MPRYVALLRGINVGGKNVIKMADLRSCFERDGFDDVTTYIQSGNVLFTSASRGGAALVERVETMLKERFAYAASVVVRSQSQMTAVVKHAPDGFGTEPERFRYDAIFLMEPLTAAAALTKVEPKDGVDRAYAGKGVLYFSRLIAKVTQSRINKIVGTPVYQRMTIRNWNTTTALVRMLDT